MHAYVGDFDTVAFTPSFLAEVDNYLFWESFKSVVSSVYSVTHIHNLHVSIWMLRSRLAVLEILSCYYHIVVVTCYTLQLPSNAVQK